MNKLTLIIVSYNSASILDRCQRDLLLSGKYPIILVDNNSPDGSAGRIKKMFPAVKVIALPENIGYGRAANIALAQVKTPFSLLLNPDLIVTPCDIRKLLNYADSDASSTVAWAPATTKNDFIAVSRMPENVCWVSGCALLFHMGRLSRIGFFDENIFLYCEENDLIKRAYQAGLKIKICRDVLFNHLIGQSSPMNPVIAYRKNWHMGWSHCYYHSKHDLWEGYESVRTCFLRHLFFYLMHPWSLEARARYHGVRAFINGVSAFDKLIPR